VDSTVAAKVIAGVLLAGVPFVPFVVEDFHERTRRLWLSAAAGVSVAFVVLRLLPDVEAHADEIADATGGALRGRVHYALVLAGIVAFYGIERFARMTSRRAGEGEQAPGRVVLGLFAAKFVTIGYLLWQQHDSVGDVALFAGAMSAHVLAIDFSLRLHYGKVYVERGRWLLGGSVGAGVVLGSALDLPTGVVGGLLAVLTGAVLLNVLKEELPSERQGRWLPFAAGAIAYGSLLALI
jgi:hypothetical protein